MNTPKEFEGASGGATDARSTSQTRRAAGLSSFRAVTLEISLKPFGRRPLTPSAAEEVCQTLYRQWMRLIERAQELSVLVWAADGSEILDYSGDLSERFEWACWIGAANPRGGMGHPPDCACLHCLPRRYMEEPPPFTYAQLAAIVRALKQTGERLTGRRVRVGVAFDPGGEFAKSSFKYERHNEICLADTMGPGSFVVCYARLNADRRRYAGYPDGIPQGLSFGRFLGRQARYFLADLGFDYLWFSNGFGLGMETWKPTGPLFDGDRYYPEHAAGIRQRILEFWRDFRAECDAPVELRGTNLGTGADLATDAVPLRDIYDGGFHIVPPPNSPWAAINGDFGIELAGYLSRIAELPDDADGYPYRFYAHDPWWLNSPWLDRYGRRPHDIYLPLSVSRLDAGGRALTPSVVAILTTDDSRGEMPDSVPHEVIPHILHAAECAPDEPGPIIWVYPFDELHAGVFEANPPRLAEAFAHDWFISSAINHGFPLNTVISSRRLLALSNEGRKALAERVLLSFLPDADSPLNAALLRHVREGGALLLYGPIRRAAPEWLDALGLQIAEPLEGEFDLEADDTFDSLSREAFPPRIRHRASHGGGGLDATPRDGARPFARARRAADVRALAVRRDSIAWTASLNSNGCDPRQYFAGEILLRRALAALGWEIHFSHGDPAQRRPITAIARHRGAFWFSGYVPDTSVEIHLNTPCGAPLFTDHETELRGGCSRYRFERSWRAECRVFVRQDEGWLSCAEHVAPHPGIRRRLRIAGLRDAIVRFFPEPDTAPVFQVNPRGPYVGHPPTPPRRMEESGARWLEIGPVAGTLLISW